ncbi:MAG: hypothetical protein JKX84_01905 [Flavobacteriales bacterium]|nr:hypothetical protein [Flavobacteriales bacterium]
MPHPTNDCDIDPNFSTSNYHVKDLNKDGLKDLIYSGSCAPYFQTYIYINTGKELELKTKIAGKIRGISNSEETILYIHKQPCCCDNTVWFVTVFIKADGSIDRHTIEFSGNTELKDGEIEETLVKGVLRSTPEIDDLERKDDCSDELIIGNHVINIDVPEKVYVLAKKGKWNLVLYNNTANHSWIGWID